MKLKGKKKKNIEQMIADGYCRVSNRHLMVARIDRVDWKEFMAREHSPRDPQSSGMDWVNSLGGRGAADHYRRCYSNDKVQFDSKDYLNFKRFPGSGDTPAPQEFTGQDGRFIATPEPVAVGFGVQKDGPVFSLASQVQRTQCELAMAHSEGYLAGEHGAPAACNPFTDEPRSIAWEDGRLEAEDEYERDLDDDKRGFMLEVPGARRVATVVFVSAVCLVLYGIYKLFGA